MNDQANGLDAITTAIKTLRSEGCSLADIETAIEQALARTCRRERRSADFDYVNDVRPGQRDLHEQQEPDSTTRK